jgi:hypothetical protein
MGDAATAPLVEPPPPVEPPSPVDPLSSAGWWQPVQELAGNAVWFAGNGRICPMP